MPCPCTGRRRGSCGCRPGGRRCRRAARRPSGWGLDRGVAVPLGGAGGVRVKNGRKLLLRYSTTQGVRGREQAGELLQDQLAKVGIDLELRPVDGGTLFGDRLPDGGFEIAAFAWVGGPNAVSGSRDTYVTGGTLNYGRFSDPEVDALFEQATAELDPDRSIALANQIDRRLWEGLHSIPLYQRPTLLA